jgi:hypothetical protein
MPEEIRHPDGRPVHPEIRYEGSDANFRWILGILLAAMVFAALVQYLVLVFFVDYRDYQSEIKKSPFPLAPGPSNTLPREPRLEQLDRVTGIEKPNIYVRQETREEVLNSVGRTKEKGYVYIPIQKAMELLENQLPARAAPAGPQRDNGLVDAGEPNSGHLLRRRP